LISEALKSVHTLNIGILFSMVYLVSKTLVFCNKDNSYDEYIKRASISNPLCILH
jgi:hypothetical protein